MIRRGLLNRAVNGNDMDYLELTTSDIKTGISALSSAKVLNSTARTFIEHASLFGDGQISNYPRWSDELGVLRDAMLRSGDDPLMCKVAKLLTELIWQWEYGPMNEDGYKGAQHLASLAKTHQNPI